MHCLKLFSWCGKPGYSWWDGKNDHHSNNLPLNNEGGRVHHFFLLAHVNRIGSKFSSSVTYSVLSVKNAVKMVLYSTTVLHSTSSISPIGKDKKFSTSKKYNDGFN